MRRLASVALVSILAAGGAAAPSTAAAGLDPDRVPWTRLRYEARKLFLKATTEVRLVTRSRAEVDGQLIRSLRGAALEPGPSVSVLELDSSLAGRRSEAAVWFDPGEAFALQRRKLRHGRNAYQKTYRFTRGGVFSHRRAPRDSGEGRRPPAEWGKVEEAFYAHPAEGSGCVAVAEPSLLFYLVAAAELEPGKPLTICAFSRKALSRVELRPTGKVPIAIDYDEISAGGRNRRQGEVETLRVAIRARPFGRDDDGFEFLGLEGDVELFLAGGIPVEVRGRLPRFGRVQVRLVEVELRSR